MDAPLAVVGVPEDADRENLTCRPTNIEDVRVAVGEKIALLATPLGIQHLCQGGAELAGVGEDVPFAELCLNLGVGHVARKIILPQLHVRRSRWCGDRKDLLGEPFPDVKSGAGSKVLGGVEKLARQDLHERGNSALEILPPILGDESVDSLVIPPSDRSEGLDEQNGELHQPSCSRNNRRGLVLACHFRSFL